MELNKRIFISHSGEDKPFVRKLHRTLLQNKYDPFFDEETLRKGDIVNMNLIMEEVDKSNLCVVVLSKDFFMKTKNPMLELVSFLAAQRKDPLKKLLPLFYKLSVAQFKETQTKWFEKWQEWEEEDNDKGLMESNVTLKRCKEALKRIRETNGVEIKEMTEEQYIEAIVSHICKIIPPDMPYEVSYAQGQDRMSKVVEDLFVEFEKKDKGFTGPCILGIYGMGGLGKTTLSKVLWNFYWSEFEGRVIRVELGSPSKESILRRMHGVLKTLRNTHEEMLTCLHDVDQARGLYLNAIGQNRVFFIIDNAEVEYEEEVRMYLEGAFHRCSRVLILSRSKSFLEYLCRSYRNFWIKEMPSLTKEEAESMFLKTLHLCRETLSVGEIYNVMVAIEMCCFEKMYHPMAVAVLGLWMKEKGDWQSVVTSLSKNPVGKLGKDIIKLLKKSFDEMDEKLRRVLLDLALYLPSRNCFKYNPYEWLSSLNELDEVELKYCLAGLRNRAFLCDGLVVHKLVKALAVEASRSNTSLGCLYFDNNSQPWERLGDANVKRLAMKRCRTQISTLSLSGCPWLRVLKIIDTQDLEKIKMGKNMMFLQSMEVRNNQLKIDPSRGLSNIPASLSEFTKPSSGSIIIEASETFNNLEWICVEKCQLRAHSDDSGLLRSLGMLVRRMVSNRQSCLSIAHFWSLRSLRMHVDNNLKFTLSTLSGCSNSLEQLDLGGFDMGKSICVPNFSHLRELQLTGCPSAHTLQFGYMPSINSISIRAAPRLKIIGGLEGCSLSLKRLGLNRCKSLEFCLGLSSLCLMENLDIFHCDSLVRLEGLEKLDSLTTLSIFDCNGLVSLFEGVTRSEYEETSSSLINLKIAMINDCPNLKDKSGIANLSSIYLLGNAINQNRTYVGNILQMWNDLVRLDVDDELFNKRSIARWKRQFLEVATSESQNLPVAPCGFPYHRFITVLLSSSYSYELSSGFFKMLTISICWSSQKERTNILSQLEASKSAMNRCISLIEPWDYTVLQCLIYLWWQGQTPFIHMILETAGGIKSMLRNFCDWSENKNGPSRIFFKTIYGILLSAVVALTGPENLPDLAPQIATMCSIILSDMNALDDEEIKLIVIISLTVSTFAKRAKPYLLNEENVRREFWERFPDINGLSDISDIGNFLSIFIHMPNCRIGAIVRLLNEEKGLREFWERFSDMNFLYDSRSMMQFTLAEKHDILPFLNKEVRVEVNDYRSR